MAELWWRSYHGAPTDSKWKVVAKRAGSTPGHVAAIWFYLEDAASQAPRRGSIESFDVEVCAAAYEWPEELVESIMSALRDKKLINSQNCLAAWDKRQPVREDNSTERTRQYRERQRAKSDETVTNGNATKRSVTQRDAKKRSVTPDKMREDESREDKNTDVRKAVDKSTGGKPRDLHTPSNVSAKRRDPVKATLAPLIRKHLWLGKTPPKLRSQPDWDMGRELSTANTLLDKTSIQIPEFAGAIQVAREVLEYREDEPLTLLIFSVAGRLDRLNDCVAVWRKRQARLPNARGVDGLQPIEVNIGPAR